MFSLKNFRRTSSWAGMMMPVKKVKKLFMRWLRLGPFLPSEERPKSRSYYYSASFTQGTTAGSAIVQHYDHSIKLQSYGSFIDHWDLNIQDFWRTYIDRYYEYFILAHIFY